MTALSVDLRYDKLEQPSEVFWSSDFVSTT